MKNIYKAFFVILIFSDSSYSREDKSSLFVVKKEKFKILFSKNDFQVYKNDGNNSPLVTKITSPEKLKNYVQLEVMTGPESGFELIIHRSQMTILYIKENLDAGGPFLVLESPDAKKVVFDFGTGPDLREFEVRNEKGVVLFKDSYRGELLWQKEGLFYGVPTSIELNSSAEAKKCETTGSADKIDFYIYNGNEKFKSSQESRIECGQ